MGCVTDPHTRARKTEVHPTKAAAEAWAEDMRAQFLRREATAAKTPFEEIVDQYKVHLSRNSRSAQHQTNVGHIIDAFIAAKLTDLSDPELVKNTDKWLATLTTRLGKPASPKTRNNHLVRLRGLAKFAVERGLLHKNPFLVLKYGKVTERLKPVFTLDEIGKLVDPAHKEHPFYKAFCCMIYTGYRQAEVRFMDWDWFLWDDACIQMFLSDEACAAITAEVAEEGEVFVPKNGRARLTRLMDELLATMKPDAKTSGAVFPELRDLDTSGFSRRFHAYVKHCGVNAAATIPRRTPHSTRHTWTCLMLASQENQAQVQQYAGHSTSDMTKHYAALQDRFRVRVRKAGWPAGELRLRDFSTGGACWKEPNAETTIAMVVND